MENFVKKMKWPRDCLGGLVDKNLCSQCRGLEFDP